MVDEEELQKNVCILNLPIPTCQEGRIDWKQSINVVGPWHRRLVLHDDSPNVVISNGDDKICQDSNSVQKEVRFQHVVIHKVGKVLSVQQCCAKMKWQENLHKEVKLIPVLSIFHCIMVGNEAN